MDPGLIFPSLGTANGSTLAKIIGGVEAVQNQFSHQVSLQSNGNHFCGGSIISTMIILTAAHCIQKKLTSEIAVVAGAHNLSDYHGTEQVRKIGKAVIHENYDQTKKRNDVAILILQKPFLFNSFVGPIEWPRHKMEWSANGTAVGWGNTHPLKQNTDEILKEVQLAIMPLKDCRKMYRVEGSLIVVDKNVICAGRQQENTCYGDSGGALICSNPYNSEPTLCGITSWGTCGRFGLPGVYTDVSKYAEWIEENILKYETQGKCQLNEFYCYSEETCISRTMLCDLDNDCLEGEDETLCKSYKTTPNKKFRCNNGFSINFLKVCDMTEDCEDGSDEFKCFQTSCTPEEYRCNNGRCINQLWQCDTINDCDEGEDERDCDNELIATTLATTTEISSCIEDQYQCNNGTCIPKGYLCDGDADCSEGEDEVGCEK